jgi:SAM-dependent methyltransferase
MSKVREPSFVDPPPAGGDDPASAAGFDWRRLPLRVRNRARRLRMNAAPKRISEDVWRKRGGEDWVMGYWNDDRSPRRDHLVDALRTTFGAPRSVLDIGCNAAPNLRRIASEFPGCRLSGFDINEGAIVGARRRFAEIGIPVDLQVGTFYDVLPAIPTDSVDVIISTFALAYVPPTHLAEVLADIVRIAGRGVVLAEPLALNGRPAGVLTVPWYDWRHDYAAAFYGLGVPPERVTVFDLPKPGAPDSGLLVSDLR